jgi:site-specific recombinase XerD
MSATGLPIEDGHFRDRVWYPAVEKAGLPRYPPRVWRHTGATLLVQDGVSLYTVQGLMGHGDPKTTQRYAHHAPTAFETIRKAWDSR